MAKRSSVGQVEGTLQGMVVGPVLNLMWRFALGICFESIVLTLSVTVFAYARPDAHVEWKTGTSGIVLVLLQRMHRT